MAVTLLQEIDLNDNSSPFSVGSITVSAGTDRLLLVCLVNYGANAATTVTAADFGGVSLHEISTHNTTGGNPNPCVYYGYLLDSEIPSGAQTMAATWSAGTLKGGHAWVFEGVNQSSPATGFNGQSDLSSPLDPTALSFGTVAAGNAVVCAGTVNGATAAVIPSTYTASTSTTWGNSTGTSCGAYKIMGSSGAESPDFDFSATGANRSAQVGVVVVAAGAGGGPAITLGTPTGTTGPDPTVGFTTDTTTGTARIVIDSAANLDTVTATQVLAGQKDNGTAAAYDSGDITVTDTTPDFAFSGLASGTYTVAAAQDDGDESNVLTWTLTIDATAPSFTGGPTITSEAETSATVGATSNEDATALVVVTASGAGQPSDGTFDASSFTDEVTADDPFSIPVTGLTAQSLLRAWVQLVDQYGNRATDSEYVLTSPTGYSRVTIGTPNPTASERLTGTADIATGDVVAWGNIVGTGSVVVYDTASWEADAGVTAFTFYIGNHTDGWGASAVQDVEGLDELAPNLTSATIQANAVSLVLAFDESVEFGAGGNGGITVSMSGGAATATYASGSGTNSLTYTLSRSIATAETGTVSYTQPTNGIEDASGNDLASLGPTVLTNNSTNDGLAPLFTNGIVATDGDSITFQASKAVVIGAGGNGGLTVSMNGGACTLTYSSGSGTSSLVYTTSRTIAGYEAGTASYTQPGNGIEDAFGNDTASFSGLPITNNSEVNTAPTAITISRNRVSLTGGVNAVVGTLGNNDPDTGDTFTYTLVAGTGDTDNASFSISGAVLRCDDPSVLGLGVYSVRVNVNDGTADYAQPLSITVYEAGLVELIKDIVRGICRDIVRDVS